MEIISAKHGNLVHHYIRAVKSDLRGFYFICYIMHISFHHLLYKSYHKGPILWFLFMCYK